MPTPTSMTAEVIPFPNARPARPVVAMRALLAEVDAAYALVEAGDLDGAAERLVALKKQLPDLA